MIRKLYRRIFLEKEEAENRLPAVNECPNCYEDINTSMDECPNCGWKIHTCSPFGAYDPQE